MGSMQRATATNGVRAARQRSVASDDERLPLDSFDLEASEVHDRVRWASSQGQPNWLWPDVAVDDWIGAMKRISIVTREIMCRGLTATKLDGNPAAIGLAGYTSGMGPLLGHWLQEGRIDATKPVGMLLELHVE